MQTETTVTYHHIPVRIPRIKTSDNTMSLNVQDSAEKLDHSHNAGKTKHSGRLRQQKEKKMQLPYNPATVLLGTYLRDRKT